MYYLEFYKDIQGSSVILGMYVLLAECSSLLHSAMFLLLSLPFLIDSIMSTINIYEAYTVNFCHDLKEGLILNKDKEEENQKILPKLIENVEKEFYKQTDE